MPDVLKELTQQAQGVVSGFKNGIEFIPEEKRDWKPAKTARSTQEILVHATYWTQLMTRAVRGEGPWNVTEEAWTHSTEELKDHASAKQLVEKSGKDFLAVVAKLSSKDLDKTAELPWGKQTLYQVVLGNNWHLTYHTAQLCYLQTLLGDTKDHM